MSGSHRKASGSAGGYLLVGLPSDPAPDQFRYRNAEILFDKVFFCSVDAPENGRIYGHSGSIWFKFWRMGPDILPERIATVLPQNCLCYSLYILEWESNIQIAAGDVSFRWSDVDVMATSE